MKKIILIAMVLILMFSLISCSVPKPKTTTTNTIVDNTKKEIEDLKQQIQALNKTITEMQLTDKGLRDDLNNLKLSSETSQSVKTTSKKTTETTTTSKEIDITSIKNGVISIIEGGSGDRKVQKLSFEDNKLFVEYSSGNWVADILKNNMFDLLGNIADLFISNSFQYLITMKANSEIGLGYLKATTPFETLTKINNLEIGFDDWINNTKFEVKDLY